MMEAEQPSEVDREPDYRFTLANERTFLAWIRTALGLLAGGVAVAQVVPPFSIPQGTVVLSVGCIALAVVLAAGSYPRWRAVQRAMRADRPLPPHRMMAVVAVGVVVVALAATVLVLLG
jgi:putative membrane protein